MRVFNPSRAISLRHTYGRPVHSSKDGWPGCVATAQAGLVHEHSHAFLPQRLIHVIHKYPFLFPSVAEEHGHGGVQKCS